MKQTNLGNITIKNNMYGITNVLSLHETKQRHRMSYNSWDHNGVFKFHTQDRFMIFFQAAAGSTTAMCQAT